MNGLNVNFNQAIGKFESAMQKKLLIKSVFYKRVFGGKGFEFDSFRNYSQDDDSGLIDWKASMKTQDLLVRQYVEERDLNIFIISDVGDNMVFGSGDKLKAETAAEISVALSHLILMSGDKLGFSLYGSNVKSIRPFMPGMPQFYGLLRSLTNVKLYGGKSDLKKALEVSKPYLKRASAVFIISDFINLNDESSKALREFMKSHETIGIMVRDVVDNKLADVKGEVIVEDIETGEQVLIDPDLINLEYQKYADEQKNKVYSIFRQAGADILEINNNGDFIVPLVNFLRRRIKKRKFITN